MDLSDLSLLDLNRNKQKIVEEKIAGEFLYKTMYA